MLVVENNTLNPLESNVIYSGFKEWSVKWFCYFIGMANFVSWNNSSSKTLATDKNNKVYYFLWTILKDVRSIKSK